MGAIVTVGGEQLFEGDAENIEFLAKHVGTAPTMVEIGSWAGHSSTILGNVARMKFGHLVCIDPFTGEGSVLRMAAQKWPVREIFDKNIESEGLKEVVSVLQMTSDEAVKNFPDKSIDLLFIDGDHRYQQMSRDLANWVPKVRGIICGHDYDIDAWNLTHPGEDFREADWNVYADCEFYAYQDMKLAVHHGVLHAVHEKFGTVKHLGRIWFKDFRDFS